MINYAHMSSGDKRGSETIQKRDEGATKNQLNQRCVLTDLENADVGVGGPEGREKKTRFCTSGITHRKKLFGQFRNSFFPQFPLKELF